jgi:hypothetical protein
MYRWSLVVSALLMAALGAPAQAPPLSVAQGTVDKVDKGTLTIRPRDREGKFEKNLTLAVTGTSDIKTLVPSTKGGKTVITQRKTDVKDLQPKQTIAVVYTMLKEKDKESAVLLQAVVQPVEK